METHIGQEPVPVRLRLETFLGGMETPCGARK